MLDGEKLQVKYFLLSLLLFICKSSHPPIYLLLHVLRRGPNRCQAETEARHPEPAQGGLELDLIKIHSYTFDLVFIRQMQPQDNMPERTE